MRPNQYLTRIFILCIYLIQFPLFAQVVNGYAEVTNITGATITLGTVNETGDSFEDGEWIIIMQMQDNTIGDVTNSASFGDLGSINSAGVYEIRQINSHTETGGSPSTITLNNNPNFTYNTCTNCTVQLITFPQFGNPNYTTTSDMSALAWDGEIGGVLAFFVDGTLTLDHNLDADEDGFRGADPNAGGSAGCQGNSNFRVSNQANTADKGESIYKNTTPGYVAGIAKILNGGGGGGSHNGGGGGGGNYTAGGRGGPGWPTCDPSAGGYGGISLAANINLGSIYMGGGGGAGEGNNNLATDGGAGGGIIIVRANEIETNSCAGLTISANGENIAFAGNDGGGGGGAAGSILLEVNSWNIDGSCPLTIEANGGNGGSVNSGATHGGGGGGGQGVIIYSIVTPTTNVTNTTLNGSGGCNNNSSPCNSLAEEGQGVDNEGILEIITVPLPIELLEFEAYRVNNHVDLEWRTASEVDNDYFIIEKSNNALNWYPIKKINGAGPGTTSSINNYYSKDEQPHLGTNYYRLKQVDLNQNYSYSNIQSVYFDSEVIVVYPNPAKDKITLFKNGTSSYDSRVYNSLGQQIDLPFIIQDGKKILDSSDLPSGLIFIEITTDQSKEVVRVLIEH